MNYEQMRRDCEYLESLADIVDQVSIEDNMTEFMENPNKRYAKELYESKILLWFGEHTGLFGDDPFVIEIAEKHNQEYRFDTTFDDL